MESTKDETRVPQERTTSTRQGAGRFSCEELVGAHDDTLRELFAAALPADPEDLGDAPRGQLLGLHLSVDAHLLLRPVVRLVSNRLLPWQGIVFDHGGNAGANVILGRQVQRFKARLGPSRFDSNSSLILSYDALGFPWSALSDELRSLGSGTALGATYVGSKLVGWFGLTRRDGSGSAA